MPSAVCRALIAVLCLPLSAFFSFVGWNKAFASLDDLVRYGSWTVHLPDFLGRLVGWSEMACALLLIAGLVLNRPWLGKFALLVLIANQIVAALVHWSRGELSALPQNGVLIALLSIVALLFAKSARKEAVQP